ncbi:MAG: Pyridoxamine 5-phosphate oxidase [Acidimicrobiales bacterium]|nr:Pyridoxamine 5-phosphate oxidase [Acidimicrobiales bacterium]
MGRDLANLRTAYEHGVLRRADLAADPVDQFSEWFDAWRATDPYDAAAVVLATADATGRPSARYVLCRGFDERGFVFYTNETSRKAEDIAANPRAALCFGWLEQARQVRVEGPVTHVSDEEADAYWAGRPRGSQLGAWASDQSEVLQTREDLERQLAEAEARFAGGDVPRPDHWGGYRIAPDVVEFWQGRADRLHDRFRYSRDELVPRAWRIDRLAP